MHTHTWTRKRTRARKQVIHIGEGYNSDEEKKRKGEDMTQREESILSELVTHFTYMKTRE